VVTSTAAPFEAEPTAQQSRAVPHEIASSLRKPAGKVPVAQVWPPSAVAADPGAPVCVDPTIKHWEAVRHDTFVNSKRPLGARGFGSLWVLQVRPSSVVTTTSAPAPEEAWVPTIEQRSASGHDTPVGSPKPPTNDVVQVRPPFFVVVTMPAPDVVVPDTTQSVAVGQDRMYAPATLFGSILVCHVLPPSVVATTIGDCEDRVSPIAQQTCDVGQDTSHRTNTAVGTDSVVQVPPPSVVTTAGSSSASGPLSPTAQHLVAVGHDSPERMLVPLGRVSLVQVVPPFVVTITPASKLGIPSFSLVS
jgi:hypothetical protein